MTNDQCDRLCQTLRDLFISPNVPDRNWEPAGLVDVGHQIAVALHHVAKAIEGHGKPPASELTTIRTLAPAKPAAVADDGRK
jgi:hypothetical protein